MSGKTIIYKFFKYFTKDWKKINRVEVFSYKLLPIILNIVTTDVIFNNVEKILSNSYWKDRLMRMEIQTQSSSEYSWQQLFQRNHEQLDIFNCHGSYLSNLSTWLKGITVFRKYVNKPLWKEKRWYLSFL